EGRRNPVPEIIRNEHEDLLVYRHGRAVNKRRALERGSENERSVGCFESGRNDSVGLVCAGGRRAAGARRGRRRAWHSWVFGWPRSRADQSSDRRRYYLLDRR